MHGRPLLAFALVVLSGCVEPGVDPTTGPTTSGARTSGAPSPDCPPVQPSRPSDAHPTLVVAQRNRIDRFVYSTGSQSYTSTAHFETGVDWGGGLHLATLGGSIYGQWDDRAWRFDAGLKPVKSLDGRFGSIGSDGDRLYLAERGAFGAFTQDLARLGNATVSLGSYKTAHDFVLCDGVAYVIDNVVMPTYIYRFDVGSARPRLLSEHSAKCNAHITDGWVDAARGEWYILCHDLEVRSMETGALLRTIHLAEPDGSARFSHRIQSVAVGDPPWAVLSDATTFYVGRVTVEGDQVRFSDVVDLGLPESGTVRPPIVVAGDLLITIVKDSLRIVDLATKTVVARHDGLVEMAYDVVLPP